MTEIYHKRNNRFYQQNVVEQKSNNNTINNNIEQKSEQLPLEMMPAIRAIQKYATQTNALGVQVGICEIKTIIDYIMTLNNKSDQTLLILNFIKERYSCLTKTFEESYRL